jgi:hypothetical protein
MTRKESIDYIEKEYPELICKENSVFKNNYCLMSINDFSVCLCDLIYYDKLEKEMYCTRFIECESILDLKKHIEILLKTLDLALKDKYEHEKNKLKERISNL